MVILDIIETQVNFLNSESPFKNGDRKMNRYERIRDHFYSSLLSRFLHAFAGDMSWALF